MDRTSNNDVSKLGVRTACTVTSIEAYRQRVEARESCLREPRAWALREQGRLLRRRPSEMHWLRRLEQGGGR